MPSKTILASALRRLLGLCKEAVTVSGAPPGALKGEDDKGRGSGGTGEPWLALSSNPIITKLEPCWPSLEPASPPSSASGLVICHRHDGGVLPATLPILGGV